jgi:hypothetical protein
VPWLPYQGKAKQHRNMPLQQRTKDTLEATPFELEPFQAEMAQMN